MATRSWALGCSLAKSVRELQSFDLLRQATEWQKKLNTGHFTAAVTCPA